MKSESEQIITGRNGNLKNALIEAGVRLLCEEGVEKLSLRRVAASCGVSHGAPYNHFIDKHDFLLTIQSYILNELKKSLLAVLESHQDEKAAVQLRLLCRSYVVFMVEHPHYLRALHMNRIGPNIDMDTIFYHLFADPDYGLLLNALSLYTQERHLEEPESTQTYLMIWALNHGYSTLLVENMLRNDGDYLAVLDCMLEKLI